LDVRFHTRDTGPPLTSLPSDNSIKTANVDPRYNSLSRAYTIVVCHPNGACPLASRFAVNHVSGLFRNASAKYAQGLCPDRAAQGVSPIFRALRACADLRCAPSFPLQLRLRSKDGETPPLAPCYPRLRQVAFGMYMPRSTRTCKSKSRHQGARHHE